MKDENIRKLREMRLPAFANAYIAQLEQPDKFAEMTFDERIAVMIDKEYDSRNSNRIKRLLKKSGLPNPKASIGDIAYLPERKLDRNLINRLGTCDFIAKKRNVLVLGSTGAGKTFLANAIAADACRDGWHALYVRSNMPMPQYCTRNSKFSRNTRRHPCWFSMSSCSSRPRNPSNAYCWSFSNAVTAGLPPSSAHNSVRKAGMASSAAVP